MKNISIFLVALLAALCAPLNADAGQYEKQNYTPGTCPMSETDDAKGPMLAGWTVSDTKTGDTVLATRSAQELLLHFAKQPEAVRQKGIWIYSHSYALANAKAEFASMLPMFGNNLAKRYNDKQWRDSENAIVEELLRLCRAKHISVYVNTSNNTNGEWKLLK